MSLHDELARIAERAPVAAVPPDTFARGRRARRRDRGLALAATVAVVTLVAGLVAWVPQRLDPPVADSGSLGVPDHLYGVPERLAMRDGEGDWSSDEVTDNVRIGRAAAAYTSSSGLPVVVGATDGEYHLLDLPDFFGDEFGMADAAVALSPDGRRLAYSYAVFGPDAATEPIPSGIRVLDLESGDVREVPLPAGEGTAVTQVTWSPDGRWLAFTGQVASAWTAMSYGFNSLVAGRVAPSAERADTVAIGNDGAALTVGDDGLVSWLVDNRLVRWDGERSTRTPVRLPGFPRRAALLPDGALAAGSSDGLEVALVAEDGSTVVLDGSGDLDPVAGGTSVVLGTVGDRLLVRTRFLDDAAGQLLLLERNGGSRAVADVEPDVPDNLTIATDLMTADRPAVERPEPDWPWSEERWVATIGAGLAVVLVLGVGLARLRRQRAL